MSSERGAGRIGVFIWLVLMAAAIFVATKTIPVRVAVLEFHDFCDEQTRYAAASHKFTEEELLKNVRQKARELEIPLDPKRISYERRKNEIFLRVQHEVTIDLSFYEWTWEYDRTFEHIRF